MLSPRPSNRHVTVDPRVVVEDAQAYLPSRPSTIRLDATDVALRHHPHSPQPFFGSATRPRFTEATVEQRVVDARAWFRGVGRDHFMWMVGIQFSALIAVIVALIQK